MLQMRFDILSKERNQGTMCFEGSRNMFSADIFAPDCLTTSRIMRGDPGRPIN